MGLQPMPFCLCLLFAAMQVSSMGRRGIRCLAVAKADETVPGSGLMGPWVLLGLLTFLDPPRPDTRCSVLGHEMNGKGHAWKM